MLFPQVLHQRPDFPTHSIRVLAPRTHHASKTPLFAVTLDDKSASNEEPVVPPMSSVAFGEDLPRLAGPDCHVRVAIWTYVVAANVVGSG
jgi:hypothetical protein